MSDFVTYLTIYRGNRLPPFYIGYSTEARIQSGYHGSVRSELYRKIWESELRNKPHLFKTVILSRHQSNHEALLREESFHRFFDVVNNPLYTNLSIGSGKFGGFGENNPRFGKHLSEEHKQKLRQPKSEAHKQKLRRPKSEEQKQKQREKMLGRHPSESTIQKMKNNNAGKNNPFFGRQHSPEVRSKMKKPKSKEHIQKMKAPKKVLVCPHCGKSGGNGNMQRWHFDHCQSQSPINTNSSAP